MNMETNILFAARNIEDLCGTIVERVLTLLDVEVPHYEWGAFHPEPDHQ